MNAAYKGLLILCGVFFITGFALLKWAEARTGVYFLAPQTGKAGNIVTVSLYAKSERLQSASVDILVDTRFLEPQYLQKNQIKTEPGELIAENSAFFFSGAVLDDLYDENRAYLKTIRLSFALKSRVNTRGVKEVMRFFLRIKEFPEDGYILLPIIPDGPRSGDFIDSIPCGGVIVRGDPSVPGISIGSPVNEARYEPGDIELKAEIQDGGQGGTVYWWNAAAIVEPPGEITVLEGKEGNSTFSRGLHVLYAIYGQPETGYSIAWTVFGAGEDVIVEILGQISVVAMDGLTRRPLAGAAVTLLQPDVPGSQEQVCLTDVDGSCVFDGLDAGSYKVSGVKKGYLDAVSTVVLQEDQAVSVTLELLPLETGKVTIYDYTLVDVCTYSAGGQPLAGATVFELRTSVHCTTDVDGCCKIEKMRVGLKSFWTAYLQEDQYAQIVGPYEIPKQDARIRLVLDEPQISGIRLTFLDADTALPLQGMHVEVMDKNGRFQGNETTDASGDTTFIPLAPGDYVASFATLPVPGPRDSKFYMEGTVELPGRMLKTKNLTHAEVKVDTTRGAITEYKSDTSSNTGPSVPWPGYSTIHLSVKSANGAVHFPVAEMISAEGENNSINLDGNGLGEFSHILPGTYTLRILAEGYQSVSFPVVIGASQERFFEITLSESLDPVIMAESTDSANTQPAEQGVRPCVVNSFNLMDPYTMDPLSGAGVEVFSLADGKIVAQGLTGTGGNFTVQDLPLSPPVGIRFLMDAGDSEIAWTEVMEFKPVTVQEGKWISYNFFMGKNVTRVSMVEDNGADAGAAVVKIRVVGPGGAPLSGFPVMIRDLFSQTEETRESGDDGFVVIESATPLSLDLKIVESGYEGVRFRASCPLGKERSYIVEVRSIPVNMDYTSTDCGVSSSPSLVGTQALSLLSVLVIDGDTGLGMEGVNVSVTDANGSLIATGVTDSSGAVTVTDMVPGNYLVEARLDSRGSWQDAVNYWVVMGASPVTIKFFAFAGRSSVREVSSMDEQSSQQGASPTLTVKVEDTGGNAMAGVIVDLLDWQGGLISRYGTSSDGSAEFWNVAPGLYSLKIYGDGFLRQTLEGLKIIHDDHILLRATLVPVPEASLSGVGELPALRYRSVLVVDSEEFNPVTGLSVTASGMNGMAGSGVVPWVREIEPGLYLVGGPIPEEPVSLTFSKDGYRSLTLSLYSQDDSGLPWLLGFMTKKGDFKEIKGMVEHGVSQVIAIAGSDKLVVKHDAGISIYNLQGIGPEITLENGLMLKGHNPDIRPLVSSPPAFSHVHGLLLIVDTGPQMLSLYNYDPAGMNYLEKVADLLSSAPINGIEKGYKWIALLAGDLIHIYELEENASGDLVIHHVQTLDVQVEHLFRSLDVLSVITRDGRLVGFDLRDPALPFLRRSVPFPYHVDMVKDAGVFSVFSDFDGNLRAMAWTCASEVVRSPQACLTVSRPIGFGQRVKSIRPFVVNDRKYAAVAMENQVYLIEFTDNEPVLLKGWRFPDAVASLELLPLRDGEDVKEYLIVSLNQGGMFLIDLFDSVTMNVALDVSYMTEDYGRGVMLWSSLGVQGAGVEGNETSERLSTFIPAGEQDFALLDSEGNVLREFYNVSALRDASAYISPVVMTVYPVDPGTYAPKVSFAPGEPLWLDLSLEVSTRGLTGDWYVVGSFLGEGATEPVDFMVLFDSSGTLSIAPVPVTGPVPVAGPVLVSGLKNLRFPLFRLPEGQYKGVLSLKVMLARPGTNPLEEKNILGKDSIRLNIQ